MNLLIFQAGTLDAAAKERLDKAGIPFVELENPESVRVRNVLSAPCPIPSHELFVAAMEAIKRSNSATEQSYFFDAVYSAMQKQTKEDE